MTTIGAALASWFQPMIDEFVQMGQAFQKFVPVLAQGLVFLIILLIVAKVLRLVIRNGLTKIGVNTLSEKVGVKALLGKFGIRAGLAAVVASVVYWMITLYAIKAAADIWGVSDISNFVNAVILFLPKLFVAIFILFAGILAAEFVRKAVETGLLRIGIDYGALIANFIYGLLAIMILTVVLGQLGIQTELLNSAVMIILAASGLAIALALGLGLRPVAKNVVSGVYARDLFPPGSVLEVEDTLATVREVGAVATRLESDAGQFIVIPNSTLVTQVNKGRRPVRDYAEKI